MRSDCKSISKHGLHITFDKSDGNVTVSLGPLASAKFKACAAAAIGLCQLEDDDRCAYDLTDAQIEWLYSYEEIIIQFVQAYADGDELPVR